MIKRFVLLMIVGVGFLGCNDDVETQMTLEEYFAEQNITNVTETSTGLYYVITNQGSGSFPLSGQTVDVHYTGYHLDGSKFDSSVDRGTPFSFRLGAGRVIKGWDEGIALLKQGGSGTLYIPSGLAYGSQGSGSIAPNEALKFDVELIAIY